MAQTRSGHQPKCVVLERRSSGSGGAHRWQWSGRNTARCEFRSSDFAYQLDRDAAAVAQDAANARRLGVQPRDARGVLSAVAQVSAVPGKHRCRQGKAKCAAALIVVVVDDRVDRSLGYVVELQVQRMAKWAVAEAAAQRGARHSPIRLDRVLPQLETAGGWC